MSVVRGRGGGDYGISRGATLLVLDRAAIARLSLPGGDIYQFARNLGLEVEVLAKAKLFPGHGYVTGELQRSVGSSTTPTGGTVVASVRATSPHAIWYHEGTRPHHIEANPPKRYLKFEGKEGLTYRPSVWHPGFSGRPFLREAMIEVLAAHGIG